VKLLRVLGLLFGIAVTLGGTLGIGILRTPGMVAASTRTPVETLLVWAAGAAFSLLAAVSIAELAVLFPKAGGFYVYARNTFPGALAFAAGWCDFLGQVAAIAYAAVTAADLITRLGFPKTGVVPALICTIAFLHWLGIRAAGRTQQLLSFSLAACYCALIAGAFWVGLPVPDMDSPAAATVPLAGLVIALRAVVVAYDGWYSAIYFTEEVKDVARNLPQSMIRGTLIVAVVYLGVNAALLYVLGQPGLSISDFPAADAARLLFGDTGQRVVLLIALLSIPSLMNALMLMAARILYGMGLSHVNRSGTPDAALLLTVAIALFLAMTGTFERLLASAAFFFVVTYVTGFVAVFVQRKRIPAPRQFGAWLFPWSTGAVLLASLIFLVMDVAANSRDALQSVLWIAGSYPVYRLVRAQGGTLHEPT
jgi:basic amino acid/polyamine antiporter, APA family